MNWLAASAIFIAVGLLALEDVFGDWAVEHAVCIIKHIEKAKLSLPVIESVMS